MGWCQRPGPRAVRGAVVSAVALAGAVAGGGCTPAPGPVDVAGELPDGFTTGSAGRCARLLAALPDSVAGLERREVTPAGAAAAAWGDPPIVLTCGGSRRLPAAALCQEIGGVDWYAPPSSIQDAADPSAGPAEVTAVGWAPAVHVAVPGDYRPPTNVLADLAPVIRETLRPVGRCG